MFTLIRGAEVYSPAFFGKKDVLMALDRIVRIDEKVEPPSGLEVEVVEAEGKLLVPGFIDQHVHIAGGGGEGGFTTRTPEIAVHELARNGITTVVGVLGTDGVTRSLEGLYAKARALEIEGVSTYLYTGSYQVPVETFTGSIQRDLVLIDKVIGAGEIAISDHRSFQPTPGELARIAAEARVGGMLSGKAGVLHLHMGDHPRGLEEVFEVVQNSFIPITQFVPTHINRNRNLLEQAVSFANRGGYLDLTAGMDTEAVPPYCTSVCDAMKFLMESGVSTDHITMSSDGNGSIPVFDRSGNLVGIGTAGCNVLLEDIRKAVFEYQFPLEIVLKIITQNPARVLKLQSRKGAIAQGMDADLVLLDRNLQIEMVFSMGRKVVENGEYQRPNW